LDQPSLHNNLYNLHTHVLAFLSKLSIKFHFLSVIIQV